MKNLFSERTKKFSEIYSDYYAVAYNAIYAKIHNTETAEELLQEVFARFYEKMDDVENPRKWLFGTLRNVLFEHYKKKTVDTADIDEIFYDANIGYVNGFRDTRIILQEAFEASENYKDEKDRIIYQLIAINYYTRKEVAWMLGITKRQVNYKYKCVADRIVGYLKKKGVNNLEELL